jgi:signal transduction histidine kinase/phage shock protein PspC (stress-responsive transcriptional regulator)
VQETSAAWLVRRTDDRVLAGLASGAALRVGIAPVYARAAFVVLAFTGGIGLLLYGAAWALTPDDREQPQHPVHPPLSTRQALGLAAIGVGVLLVLESLGLWFGDALVWTVALISFGAAFILDRRQYDYRSALGQIAGEDAAAPSRGRVVVGGLLMFAGVVVLVQAFDGLASLGPAVVAVGLTATGFLLVFGPWVWRLISDLTAERRERIRSEERSEVAAHLHDSVLQTLALIQRSDDPKRMVTLARAQERDLRDWLYDDDNRSEASLEAALLEASSRIEADHDVPVNVVVVGDRPIGDRGRALVQASVEAMTNAAKHSGSDKVSVYAEANDQAIDIWVSDQGSGFDPEDLPEERLGIKESIHGRMERHRGVADITSSPEGGTEVHLHMDGFGT